MRDRDRERERERGPRGRAHSSRPAPAEVALDAHEAPENIDEIAENDESDE
jgi:hypothetical protein